MFLYALNDNNFSIENRTDWKSTFHGKPCPKVALLILWQRPDFQPDTMGDLIKNLIDGGCRYFICAGKDSEFLHNYVDNIYLESSIDESDDFLTTWHDDETNEDIADFFINSKNVKNSLLVAFFDESNKEDKDLKLVILDKLK
jgi:hypothetical protein